ncbi:MAG: HypC/HybG/HupF family hydrogenase formation chaperone [Acidobacteriota bacterium]|nr:MAG: HypC/HybG/HupF family hydrogenase formation chaperone [Acidobacteriota bacterium]
MCLGVPMRIVEIQGVDAVAELGNVRRRVRLDFVEDARPGEYVIVHVGFAIERLDEKEALETLSLFEAMGAAGGKGSDSEETP